MYNLTEHSANIRVKINKKDESTNSSVVTEEVKRSKRR